MEVKMEETMKNGTHTVGVFALRSPIHARWSGVRLITSRMAYDASSGLVEDQNGGGNGTDRAGTEKKQYEEGDTSGERERERGESNLNRNSDRYLWKLTGLEVNRGTETLSRHSPRYMYTYNTTRGAHVCALLMVYV